MNELLDLLLMFSSQDAYTVMWNTDLKVIPGHIELMKLPDILFTDTDTHTHTHTHTHTKKLFSNVLFSQSLQYH